MKLSNQQKAAGVPACDLHGATAPQLIRATPNRSLRTREVMEITGLPRSTLYLLLKKGQFVRPAKFGPRLNRYSEAEVLAWIQARMDERKPSKPKHDCDLT